MRAILTSVKWYLLLFLIYISLIIWKDWCWSWNSNTLAISCEESIHWERSWCWERLKAGGEGDDRGWDGWMASPTWWTWIWVNSRRWWWTGRPGVLQFMGSQSVGHNWATELSWTKSITQKLMSCSSTWCTKSAYPFFFTLLKGLCCSSSCLWLFSLLQLLPPMRI